MKEETIRYQDYINMAIASLIVLLLLFAVILYRTIASKKYVGELLQQKVRQRTSFHEREHNELHKRYNMQRVMLLKLIEEAANYTKQIKKISKAPPGHEGVGQAYFMKIDDISDTLFRSLADLKHNLNEHRNA